MKINMTKVGSEISEKDIIHLEEITGYTLPDTYKQFLLKYNGGEPNPYFFLVPDWKYGQSLVSEFKGIDPNRVGLDLLEIIDIKQFDLPKGVIPIGGDPGGNLILIDLKTGKIYFWDHENVPNELNDKIEEFRNAYFLANTFYEFVANLKKESEL